MGSRIAHLIRSASVLAGLWFAFAPACSSDEADALRRSELSEGCLINTDCKSPLVCAFRRCHVQCQDSRDCEPEQLCIDADKPFRVCQLEIERDCQYNSQCPGDQVCAVDARCRDQCLANSDCGWQQACTQGTCAEEWELVDGKLPVTNSDGGQSCTYNSECPNPQVCSQGICRIECLTTKDCTAGLECIESRCALPGTSSDGGVQSCAYDSDCPAKQICVSGQCRCECKTAVDCAGGKLCDGCGCVTAKPDGAPPGYGAPCSLPSDCDSGLVCTAGSCLYECNASVDCPTGFCCFSHQCTTGPVCALDGGADAADGGFEGGAPCVKNLDCDDGLWCNGPEQCTAGKCAAALDTPCNSHSSCIQDSCTESTQQCSSVVLAAQDGDGDTYLDFGCGGMDCDDADPSVYPGATELCDQKDNDCNAKVDDKSRGPYGLQYVLTAGTASSGAAVPNGTGFTTFYEDPATKAVIARSHNAAGVPTGSPITVISFPAAFSIGVLGADTGAGTILALVRESVTSPTANIWAVLVKTDLSAITSFKLGAMVGTLGPWPDVVWTGTDYLLAWETSLYAVHLAHVSATGALSADVTPVVAGHASTGYKTFGVTAGTSFGLGYTGGSVPTPSSLIYGASGSLLAGPATTPPSAFLSGFGATANGGFIMLLTIGGSTPEGHHVSAQGQVGPSLVLPFPAAPDHSDSVSDGSGAMIGFSDFSSAPTLVYVAGNGSAGVESTQALAPDNNTGMVNLSGGPSSFVFSHFDATSHKLRWVRAGCQ